MALPLDHVQEFGATAATVEYVDHAPPPGEHAYGARVTQERERSGVRPPYGVAYSSRVWLTVGQRRTVELRAS